MTLQEIRKSLVTKFTNSETPQLDADCILEHFLKCDRTFLLANRELEISPEIEKEILVASEKRAGGLPIAYITNHKEFFGHDFFVTSDVLIPKPDTETLVAEALKVNNPHKICDMCTGSGCVGISLALELAKKGFDNILFTFVDISDAALAIAKKNIDALVPEKLQKNIQLVKSDLFEKWGRYGGFPRREGSGERDCGRSEGETSPFRFSLIVTNPPYIPTNEANEILKDGRSEPILALDGGGDDGLSLIRRLVPQAAAHLEPNGVLLMETGEYNAEAATEIFRDCGFSEVEIFKDLSGQLRVVKGTLHRTF